MATRRIWLIVPGQKVQRTSEIKMKKQNQNLRKREKWVRVKLWTFRASLWSSTITSAPYPSWCREGNIHPPRCEPLTSKTTFYPLVSYTCCIENEMPDASTRNPCLPGNTLSKFLHTGVDFFHKQVVELNDMRVFQWHTIRERTGINQLINLCYAGQ